MSIIERLHEMRNYGGEALTRGLSEDVVMRFAEQDPRLGEAVDVAYSEFQWLCEERPDLLAGHDKRRRAVRCRRLRHAGFWPQSGSHTRRDEPTAPDGQHHDAAGLAEKIYQPFAPRDRAYTRHLPVRPLPVHEQRLRGGYGRGTHL